jgi:hypothetical protein
MPTPTPPEPNAPAQEWEHFTLYENVKRALIALPQYFRPEINISGVLATDIFALNSSLGTTIEEKTVETLNQVRNLWDHDQRYPHFNFVRQTQTFPDVILRRVKSEGHEEILMGIELKGWYVLAKEGEPSLRFVASELACSDADLVVVFPWALSSVISGYPRLFTPFIAPAKFVARYRNFHWTTSAKARQPNRNIQLASGVSPYPRKSDLISDHAEADSGGNFGRIARTNLMDQYKQEIDAEQLCGVPAKHWRNFFKIFAEGRSSEQLEAAAETFGSAIAQRLGDLSKESVQEIRDHLSRIAAILGNPAPQI